MNTPPKQSDTDLVEKLSGFDTATVANAIEHFKVRDPVVGYASLELRAQISNPKPMVGYAVTCTKTTTSPGDKRPQGLEKVLDLIDDSRKPAVLVFQYLGDDRLRGCSIGDMFCAALDRLGVVGAVADHGVRDLQGISDRVPGFQVFSPGCVASHGYGVVLDVDVNVSVCGLEISTGDLLHGDENGLISIPLDIADEVIKQAQIVRNDEEDYFRFINRKDLTLEELKKGLIHH